MATLNIGRDFNRDPAGRYFTDGVGSGEEFREQHLKPALLNLEPNEKLEILLDDDVLSYGSSFLVEGFAGIVRYGYMKKEELLAKIELIYTDPDFELYADRVKDYIAKSEYNSAIYKSTKK